MTDVDPRLVSAVDHVQRAALEMIAAMRNALEVAEDLVEDPSALQALMRGVVLAARSGIEGDMAVANRAGEPRGGDADAPIEAPAQARVKRIRVD